MWRVSASAASSVRQESQAHLLIGDGVVAGKRCDSPPPHQVAARIADVGHDRAIVTQRASHHGGGHPGAIGSAATAASKTRALAVLHQRVAARLAGLLLAWLHGNPRAGFPSAALEATSPCCVPAHAIGQRKQPAVRARLLGRLRRDITNIVLVVRRAHGPTSDDLGELDSSMDEGSGSECRGTADADLSREALPAERIQTCSVPRGISST